MKELNRFIVRAIETHGLRVYPATESCGEYYTEIESTDPAAYLKFVVTHDGTDEGFIEEFIDTAQEIVGQLQSAITDVIDDDRSIREERLK